MDLLFCVNILLYIFLECYYPIFLSKKLNLGIISPVTILAYSSIPILLFKVFLGPAFLLDNGLFNKYFNYAILMTNTSLIMKYVVTALFLHLCLHSKLIKRFVKTFMPHWHFRNNKVVLASIIILFFAILFFILLASHSFGVVSWILNPREGYQFHRSGAGHFYVLSILCLSVSYTIFSIFLKKDSRVILCTVVYMFLAFMLGSKGVILSFCVSCLIFLWFRRYKYLSRIFLLAVPFVCLLLLINFGSFEYSEIASYFDYYVNSAMYYEEYFKGGIDLFYGKISATNFWGLLPRALFPEKPYVYGMLLVNEHFFPGAAEASHTPEFGGPVMAFADWGVMGVIFSSLFNYNIIFKIVLYLFLFKDYNIETIRNNPSKLYCLIILFSPSFMFLVGFPLSFILWLFIVKIISLTNRVVIKPQSTT